ncbi:hypothetical protein MWU75_15350 [Ornithinimicrobium sp. F0845]|uniref:hypothetical protein n=1 Tax=Ornithinimicrobium sp. F0845 TaxID=2926412 RepID=UPI001FF43877|nr:hypothetical protein [Ornithinimicrobium sp. F0845]MCK0113523.1 hypothetical protein [Ornithinimicrobium sp. F0845]
MTADASVWSRRRLLTILVAAAGVGLLLILGLGLFVWQVLRGGQENTAQVATVETTQLILPESGQDRRELIAAGPMLEVEDPRAYQEGEVSAAVAESIVIPPARSTGPVGVPTGYPRSPEGAVAQLAAIDVVVLQGMSVPATHEVYRQWGTGEGDPKQWVMTTNVTDFLTAAAQSGQEKEAGLAVTVTPAAGQVKGVDGQDWVVACVLLDIRAVLVDDAQVAYGHCEAMTWQGDRWLIDTTTQVAPAPSTWPGTDLAVQAGWRTWTPGN